MPLYKPKYRLRFQDGKLLLATVRMKGYYLFAVGMCSVLSFFLFVSLRKLKNFSQRSIFGVLFYGLLAFGTFYGATSIANHTRSFITKVWLTKSGRSLLIRRGFIFNRPYEVAIRDIELPEFEPPTFGQESLTNVGYPLVIEGEVLWMLKETDRVNLELFSAVFNGHEIDTSGDPNEIVIDN